MTSSYRVLWALCLCSFLGAGSAHAQTERALTLGYFDNGLTQQWQDPVKFQSLAKALGEALGAAVRFVWIGRAADLEAGMKAGKFDLVAARQPHELAVAIKTHHYRYVANAVDDFSCLIITNTSPPLKALKDIVGKRIVALPSSTQCIAELRDAGVRFLDLNPKFVRDADFITQFLDAGLAEVGVGLDSTSPTAKRWIARGRHVLHRTTNKPYFPLLAKPTITDKQIAAMRVALTAMEHDSAGAELLQALGLSGFRADTEVRILDVAREIEMNGG